jgi:hypothetical protein
MALLYDVTLKFPAQHSSKKLEQRGRQTRRPSAWAPENEDLEEAGSEKSKLHWCPVSGCNDMELLPIPKAKVMLFHLCPSL